MQFTGGQQNPVPIPINWCITREGNEACRQAGSLGCDQTTQKCICDQQYATSQDGRTCGAVQGNICNHNLETILTSPQKNMI